MSLPVKKALFGAALITTSFAAAASDAVLTSVTGAALMNQGGTYVTAAAQSELNAGDRLMVMEGGSAVVTYADGCTATVSDSEVLTIGQQSTCAGDQAAAEDTGPSFADAMGASGAGGALLIGGTGIGVAGLAVSTDSNGKGGPISP